MIHQPVGTIPEIGRGRVKENDGEGEFNYYIIGTFVNATMYSQHNNKKI
jgi:hypothetical protein